jgi:hypothetical protein
MYDIKQYSKDQAEKLGVKIRPSHNPKKKIDVFDWNGQFICSIGARGYGDFPTYIETRGYKYAENRRRLYRIRHHKERDNHNWEGSPSYYSWYILW